MTWVPIFLATFKVIVLGIGMFYAIKWHYDQGKKEDKVMYEPRAVLRAGGKAAVVFMVVLLALGLVTFGFSKMLGLDLNYL